MHEVFRLYYLHPQSGQSVLENVRLRPESLEHLQLPITIREGSVGKLRLQARFKQPLELASQQLARVQTQHEQSVTFCFLTRFICCSFLGVAGWCTALH
jgi:hypothetical protein